MKFVTVSESALESIKRMGEAQNARIAELEKERDGVLEKAAKLCESARPPGGRAWTMEQVACFDALTHVADAIRALKDAA
jgi:hypothetical protein